jgi:hypothetical protein
LKKTITISESELVRMVKQLVEQVNLDNYDREDFLDAFFQLFRGWVRRFHDKAIEYPMSYLLKKYSKDFVINYLGQEWFDEYHGDDDDFVPNEYDMVHIIREIILREKYSLPKLIQQEKFTDKYGQVIQNFIEEEFPDYVKLVIEEPNPHYFVIKPQADVEKYLKDPNKINLGRHHIERKIEKFLKDYLGLEFGYIKYGQSELHVEETAFPNVEEWSKKQLQGVIKKEFKKLPESKDVKSIKFELTGSGADLKLSFTSTSRWNSRTTTRQAYERKLEELGYGPNLDVEI